MEEKKIYVTDDKGNQIEGEIVFSFEANGDDFVIYQIKDEAFCAKVDEKNQLSPVQEDEWPLVEKIFNEYMENQEVEDEH